MFQFLKDFLFQDSPGKKMVVPAMQKPAPTYRHMYAIKVGSKTLAHYATYLEACAKAAEEYKPGTYKIVYE